MRCEWLQLIIVWEWGRPLRTISVRETRLSYRTTKDCQTCLHYKPSSFTLLGGVLTQYIWLELEMLVVQTYTAESGVCSTCFVTALYWNKDCALHWNKDRLLHQPQKKLPFSYKHRLLHQPQNKLPFFLHGPEQRMLVCKMQYTLL